MPVYLWSVILNCDLHIAVTVFALQEILKCSLNIDEELSCR